jgi:hypothetical protein
MHMEVQVQTVMPCQGWGYVIAALDEADEDLIRVSEEFYLDYKDALFALLSGSWTPA